MSAEFWQRRARYLRDEAMFADDDETKKIFADGADLAERMAAAELSLRHVWGAPAVTVKVEHGVSV